MSQHGCLILIEARQNELKATHVARLRDKLHSEGYMVEYIELPDLSKQSSYFVGQYLQGSYGSETLNPYVTSLLYGLERFDHKMQIQEALDANKVVLVSSYTATTMSEQGVHFASVEEKRGFYLWLDVIEFQMLQLPRPTLNLILDGPKPKKQPPNTTSDTYDDLVRLFPKDFQLIDTARRGKVMDEQHIQKILWEKIRQSLPNRREAGQLSPITVSGEGEVNPYISVDSSGIKKVTKAGFEYLAKAVTSVSGPVYAFTNELNQMTVAAAMARLSRSSDDARVLILNEFAGKKGKDASLLDRVITQYGDDSVQQLVGLHVVVEGASNLLTKELEWGRLAAYLEQSTRYIYFDEKDASGRYSFYTPKTLDAKTARKYDATMTKLFDNYSLLVRGMVQYIKKSSAVPEAERDAAWKISVKAQACDAVRAVLPVATKSTVGIFGSGQAIESAIMRLSASESAEAREVAADMLEQARKVIPNFLKRADLPERGGATTAYMARTKAQMTKLAAKVLPQNYEPVAESVRLHEFWPRNELDLVPYMLYDLSDASLESIKLSTQSLSIDEKQTVFNSYIGERLNRRHKPSRALEHAHYTWDIVCDYGIFRDLQRHRMVDDLRWQRLSPRMGFDVPEELEAAGLADLYEQCFDMSAELYSALQSAGYQHEAQYVTLLGHKMRWTITYNAREAFHFHELRTSPQGHPAYRQLVQSMHDKLCEVHPLLGAAMRFVNTDESPELTRLAAERAAEHKRSLLDIQGG